MKATEILMVVMMAILNIMYAIYNWFAYRAMKRSHKRLEGIWQEIEDYIRGPGTRGKN